MERFLGFIGQSKEKLNSVLLGYWCNLFKSLVITHPKEVFTYVYEN